MTLIPLPSLPFGVPCLLPWPVRGLCPSALLGYDETQYRRNNARRARSALGSPVTSKEVVLLRKELMEGVVVKPSRGGEGVVGGAFVSIGREDSFAESAEGTCNQPKEIRTTGWVVVRFIPRPTGIRWLLSSHPLPPLILLPPISLSLTLSSALIAFLVINYLSRSKEPKSRKSVAAPMSEEALLQEKRDKTFRDKDREEKAEAERRRKEWEEVESSASGLQRMPAERKRGASTIASSTIGGSETTAPSAVTSFAPISEHSDTVTESIASDTETETATESNIAGERSRRTSDDEWEEAR